MKSENISTKSHRRQRFHLATAAIVAVVCILTTACASADPATNQAAISNGSDKSVPESSDLNIDRFSIKPLGITEDPYDPGSADYYYAYNLTNTSDQDIEYIELGINIIDEEGNILDDTFTPYPHTLAPGESAYIDDYLWESDSVDLKNVYALIVNDISYKDSQTQEEYIIPLSEKEQKCITIYLKDIIPYNDIQVPGTDAANT